MLTPAYVRILFDYHYWATAIILRTAEQLTPEQFAATPLAAHSSPQLILNHMLWAEMIWRSRWEGTSPDSIPGPTDLTTLAVIKDHWRAEEAAWRATLAHFDDNALARPISYRNVAGIAYANPLWQILAQVANHGTQHRAELGAMFTILGHSPGDLDIIKYFREHAS